MKANCLCIIILMILIYSCKKEGTDDGLPYCYIKIKENERIIDCASFKSKKVVFSHAWRFVDNKDGERIALRDNSMTQFHYVTTNTPTRTSQIEPEITWIIDSSSIVEGKKYYCDSAMVRKKEQYRQIFLCYNILGDSGIWTPSDNFIMVGGNALLHGWISFSRNTDNPNIILTVEFEADFVKGIERKDTLRYREGRIDFTSRMANMIEGGERLR